jgi:small conductance mechanosensitive channel
MGEDGLLRKSRRTLRSKEHGQTIKNYSQNETRRIDLVIGVAYDDDLDLARDAIFSGLRSDSRVLLDPEPVVEVSQLGDSSVNFVVRPWCKQEDYWKVRFDLTRQVKIELEASGCSIPFQQRDIHLHQVA